MFYIYKITNTVNGKNYIGYTSNPKNRWSAHKSEAKAQRSKQNIHKAIAKHGVDKFTFDILLEHHDKDYVLKTMEDEFIKQYKAMGPHGYNMAPGGGGSGPKTDTTRKLLSIKNIGREPWNKGLKGLTPWNKGLTKADPRVAENLSKSHSTRKQQGYDPWNKGLHKDTDDRVKNNGEAVSKARRSRNIEPWNKGLTKETDQRVAENGRALKESRQRKKSKLD